MLGDAILSGGPQDGAIIHFPDDFKTVYVYVGRKWLGDGYAAFSRDPCDRFPVRYWHSGDKYMGKVKYLFDEYIQELTST